MSISLECTPPLLSNHSDLVPLRQKDRDCNFVKYIHREFILREKASSLSKTALVGEKTLAIGIGVVGNYPSIAPALLLARGNKVLEVLYAFGVTSSMAQDGWCMDQLLVEKLVPKSAEEKEIARSTQRKVFRVLKKMGIFTFALISTAPDAYISYYYNHKSIAWLFLSFASSLGFPLVSLSGLVGKVSEMNLLPCSGRNLSDPLQEEAINKKKLYLRAVCEVQKKLILMTPEEREENLSALFLQGEPYLEHEKVAQLIKQVMEIADTVEESRGEDSFLVKFSREFAGAVGLSVSTFHYVLLAVLMQEFSEKFLSKNHFVQAFLVSACILPKCYLTISATKRVFKESMDKLISRNPGSRYHCPTIATKVYPKTTKSLQVLSVSAAALSMAPSAEVIIDTFDMDTGFGKMVMGAVMVTGVSVGVMMVADFVDQIMGLIIKKTGTAEQKDLIDWVERFEQLEKVIASSSSEEFSHLLSFMREEEPEDPISINISGPSQAFLEGRDSARINKMLEAVNRV